MNFNFLNFRGAKEERDGKIVVTCQYDKCDNQTSNPGEFLDCHHCHRIFYCSQKHKDMDLEQHKRSCEGYYTLLQSKSSDYDLKVPTLRKELKSSISELENTNEKLKLVETELNVFKEDEENRGMENDRTLLLSIGVTLDEVMNDFEREQNALDDLNTVALGRFVETCKRYYGGDEKKEEEKEEEELNFIEDEEVRFTVVLANKVVNENGEKLDEIEDELNELRKDFEEIFAHYDSKVEEEGEDIFAGIDNIVEGEENVGEEGDNDNVEGEVKGEKESDLDEVLKDVIDSEEEEEFVAEKIEEGDDGKSEENTEEKVVEEKKVEENVENVVSGEENETKINEEFDQVIDEKEEDAELVIGPIDGISAENVVVEGMNEEELAKDFQGNTLYLIKMSERIMRLSGKIRELIFMRENVLNDMYTKQYEMNNRMVELSSEGLKNDNKKLMESLSKANNEKRKISRKSLNRLIILAIIFMAIIGALLYM